MEKPYYGYRISKYITAVFIGGGIICIALSFAFTIVGYSTWVLVLWWTLGVILFNCGGFWHLAFSFVNDPKKIKDLQVNFADQLQTLWDGNGKVLDIGTGLGRAAIEVARRFPESQVIGIDTWKRLWSFWGMTKSGAEKNERIENVGDRCSFQYGNALELPFEEGEFQLVVSAFAFHEIRIPDRTILFKEVVRVLDSGGIFFILDIFPKGYKVRNIPELLNKVEHLGVKDVKFVILKDAGVNLGRFAHIWPMGYLSGRKAGNTAS